MTIIYIVIVSMVFENIEVVSLNCCMLLKICVICLIMVIHMTLFILTLRKLMIRSHIKDSLLNYNLMAQPVDYTNGFLTFYLINCSG